MLSQFQAVTKSSNQRLTIKGLNMRDQKERW